MLKPALIFATFLVSLIAPNHPVLTQNTGETFEFNQCAPSHYDFKHGEELVYKLYYSLPPLRLSAGEVTFNVIDKGDTYLFIASGRTYSSYEWFYKVRDYYETEVDKKTLAPIRSVRNIHEGDYKMYEVVDFDNVNDRAFVRRGSGPKDLDKGERFDIRDCVNDVLSLLYVLRTTDSDKMKPGDEIPMNLFIDKEEYSLKMTYVKKEPRKRIPGLGHFKTKVFAPEVVKGTVFKGEKGMTVWVSDDANQIPMLIKSPVSVGSVKAVLKSYKNLRY